jgi:hypothetical protein
MTNLALIETERITVWEKKVRNKSQSNNPVLKVENSKKSKISRGIISGFPQHHSVRALQLRLQRGLLPRGHADLCACATLVPAS